MSGKNWQDAQTVIYAAVEKIRFEGAHFCRDPARRDGEGAWWSEL